MEAPFDGLLAMTNFMSYLFFRFFAGWPGNLEKTYSYHSARIWNNLILMVVNIFYKISAVGGQSFWTIIACGGILLMILAEIFSTVCHTGKKNHRFQTETATRGRRLRQL